MPDKIKLYINVDIATLADARYSIINDAALLVKSGEIAWLGEAQNLPSAYAGYEKVDCGGRLMTPALIDCHTHLAYAGDRALEFEMKLQGASYEEIARSGGGIISTVQACRHASEDEIFEQSLPRLQSLMAEGVRCVEIKSGYGLDLETELKLLRVIKRLREHSGIDIVATCLAAHAVPPEYADRADGYVALVCDEILPRVKQEGLAEFVDVFCEGIGFSLQQTQRVLEIARELGFKLRVHAEQLSLLGASVTAAQMGALSSDHLEYLDECGVQALAAEGTTAVLLPGAFYFLGETKLPPIESLRRNGVPMAVATDCNPGSSPCESLLLMANMSTRLFGLTPEEALAGITLNAAKVLGRESQRGSLEVGKLAELALWNVSHPRELIYNFGRNPLWQSVGLERKYE